VSAAVSDVDHPSKFLRFFKVGDNISWWIRSISGEYTFL